MVSCRNCNAKAISRKTRAQRDTTFTEKLPRMKKCRQRQFRARHEVFTRLFFPCRAVPYRCMQQQLNQKMWTLKLKGYHGIARSSAKGKNERHDRKQRKALLWSLFEAKKKECQPGKLIFLNMVRKNCRQLFPLETRFANRVPRKDNLKANCAWGLSPCCRRRRRRLDYFKLCDYDHYH